MRRKNEYVYLYSLLIIGFLMIIISLSFKSCDNQNYNRNDYNGVKWNGSQQISVPTNQKYITVSGINDLVFTANNTKQYVNFENPKENDCLMDIKILLQENKTDKTIWQTENVKPDYGIYEVELNSTLSVGEYPAYVVLEFKTLDGNTKLNSATFKINITVKE